MTKQLGDLFRDRMNARRRAYMAYLKAKARGEDVLVVLDPDWGGE